MFLIIMQHWSKLIHPEGDPWPVGRMGHASVALDDDHLLVTGGRDEGGVVLGDMWLLALRSGRWREVSATIITPTRAG